MKTDIADWCSKNKKYREKKQTAGKIEDDTDDTTIANKFKRKRDEDGNEDGEQEQDEEKDF